MRRPFTRRRLFPGATVTAMAACLALSLAACGSDDGDGNTAAPGNEDGEDAEETGEEWNPDPNAEVTISYSNLPPVENEAQRENAIETAEEFMELYPNITLEGEELVWDPQTFNAMLAGDTVPTVMRIPFTQMSGLMNRGQAADLTDAIADYEVLSSINPALQDLATDEDGRVFGIPTNAYALGIVYHRGIFEDAGLDPDNPPDTWEGVREAARAITEETGLPGFLMFTTEGTGGWILSGLTNTFGGEMEQPDGDSYAVTANTDATLQALDFLRTMRWDDNSMGDNFLLSQSEARDEVAAGRAGMFIGGTNGYESMVFNLGMDPDDFGVMPMPQPDGALGTLSGGNFDVIDPRATQEEIAAALLWTEYRMYRTQMSEELAVENAESRVADGLPVGAPNFPLIDQESTDRVLGWIADSINVPRENYGDYLASIEAIPLVPEAPEKAPELYAALDPVVQAALTREDADLEALLTQVESDINALIAQG